MSSPDEPAAPLPPHSATTARQDPSAGIEAEEWLTTQSYLHESEEDARSQTGTAKSSESHERIGRYQVRRRLGKGAFGEVFEAWDESLNRLVAIKILSRTGGSLESERWLAEARTLASLDHPNIVPVYDVGRTEDGSPCIVSKFINGGNLAESLRAESPTVTRSIRIVIEVARALGYAHERGFFHRDVKPANILLTADGRPVLADFGLALHETEFGTGDRFVGTPAYMSPEQARREAHRIDARSDLYSLGVVLYEMLTGRRPFQGGSAEEILDCIRTLEVRPPRQLNRSVDRELDRICLKALAKRASDRHSTVFDFADELEHALGLLEQRDLPDALAVDGAREPVIGSGSQRSAGSSRSGSIVVVPRGLRSFDAPDADFFPALVPGARDREGIPESIRFWQRKIEEREPDSTFRVGVLLGPTGSGKSSLLRAGVVPRLEPSIVTLVVDARPESFAEHLLRRLHYVLPTLTRCRTVREVLGTVRQRRTLAPDQKLLLVIDQFEQHLNRLRPGPEDELLEALRQCDGAVVQAILLVRDDFTLPLARFMDQLEEPLLQNHNFATVDRFGIEHARHVLIAFGRAYGTLGEELNADQKQFVDAVVTELASDGQLVPVQLALLADIVKDRPWLPSTLQALGGARGVGVKFLEERITGTSANPSVQMHRHLIQRLLAELLPSGDEFIKAQALTRTELLARLHDVAEVDAVDRSLMLLDTELRLVTSRSNPSTEDGKERSGSDASNREPAYQLTHDFMVPAIRAWLQGEERTTRSGRARARLRELAQAWSFRPEPRRLPSLPEWLSIRLLTTSARWSPVEAQMMKSASRRLARRVSILLVVAILGLGAMREALHWSQARELSLRLLTVDTSEIDKALLEVEPLRRWVEPRLRELERLDGSHADEGDARSRRRKLNVALAMASRDEEAGATVVKLLPTVQPDHLFSVRTALRHSGADVTARLWSEFESRLPGRTAEALPYGAVLIELQPDHEAWNRHAAPIAEILASSRAAQVSQWGRLYQSLAPRLVPLLLERFARESDPSSPARANLVELLAMYTERDVPRRVQAIRHSHPTEIPLLMSTLSGDLRQLVTALRKELPVDYPVSRPPPAASELPNELQRAVRDGGGAFDAECVWIVSLPKPDWESLHRGLLEHGYALRSLRQELNGSDPRLASIWRRSSVPSRIDWELPTEQAAALTTSLPSQGWELVDFDRGPESGDDGSRWTLVWQQTKVPPAEMRIYFEEPYVEHQQAEMKLRRQGFAVLRFDSHIAENGTPVYSAVWRKVGDGPVRAFGSTHYAAAFGDRHPGSVIADVRSRSFRSQPERFETLESLAGLRLDAPVAGGETAQKRDEATRADAGQRLKAVGLMVAAGRHAQAKTVLEELLPAWPSTFRVHELLAEVHFWAKDAGALKTSVENARRASKIVPLALADLELKVAILDADSNRAEEQLKILQKAAQENVEASERYVRALATVAQHPALGDLGKSSEAKLFAEMQSLLTRSDFDASLTLLEGTEFDAFREHPELLRISHELGLNTLVCGAYFESPTREARVLFDLSRTAHQQQASELRAQGFVPVALAERAGGREHEQSYDSVWQRLLTPVPQRLTEARAWSSIIFALGHAREYDAAWDALQDRWGHEVRTQVETQAPHVMPPKPLVDRLLNPSTTGTAEQRNLLRTLGGYLARHVDAKDQERLAPRLASWATSPDDAGLRAAAEWCRQQWSTDSGPAPVVASPSSPDRAWSRNSLGQVMVTLRAKEPFLMGSPIWETGRDERSESRHWARIGRNFALSATEVTIGQFREFLRDPQIAPYYRNTALGESVDEPTDESLPQTEISWLDARRFCEWLSERESIEQEQRCYPDVWAKLDLQAVPPPGYLRRSGYRLPTEMEWEFAARAGSNDAFHCGDDGEFLSHFEWINRNAAGTKHPVGRLRPSDGGLFDMLGNVAEWCDDADTRYDLSATRPYRSDHGTFQAGERLNNLKPNVRGGYYGAAAVNSRSAKRLVQPATPGIRFVGFRVARTLP